MPLLPFVGEPTAGVGRHLNRDWIAIAPMGWKRSSSSRHIQRKHLEALPELKQALTLHICNAPSSKEPTSL